MQVVYPKRFISRTINNFLNDSSQDDNIIPNFLFEERKKVFIRLPFCGKNEKLSKTFIAKLNKFFIHLSLLMMNSSVLILAVCRTPVTYELSKMTLLSMSSRSSVDRAPVRCLGGHGFDSCQGLRFFSLSYARVMLISSLCILSNDPCKN